MTAEARPDRPAADHVYSWVRNGIANGRFRTGEQYSIHQIADELGISRTPAREAVLRLADIGLVRIDRNRGFSVEPLTAERVRLTYESRMLLEVPAAMAAARNVTHGIVASLALHMQRMDDYLAEANMDAYREWDRSFHAEIIRATGNARIVSLSALLRDASVQMWGTLSMRTPNFRASSWEQHAAIAEAIESGDADRAGEAMRAHLLRAGLTFMRRAALAAGEPVPEEFPGLLHASG